MAFDKIIVLDDEMIIRKSLEQQLRKRRYSVASASTLAEAQTLIGKDKFDLMFVDVRLPDGQGTELLEMFQRNPDAPIVIMITGYGSIEDAVECMQKGAFSYIAKPFSQEQIDVHIKRAEEFAQMKKVNRYFSEEVKSGASKIVGNSPAIKQLRKMIRRVSVTDATVLITGENGTGKELVAQELYRLSPRSDMPYIKVNCAAVSETLIESEFFGHEKGAFTGATEKREGRFELAHNGTILLDEVSEIPPKLQAKLLRVLQENEFERVGGNRTININTRVLATTNRNLGKAIEKGEFREDLFYRLNVFPIVVPALRERKEDIMLLANEFLKQSARRLGIKVTGFSDEAIRIMETHIWPGNVRELQNTIERAVILSEDDSPVEAAALNLMAHPLILSSKETPAPTSAIGTQGTAPLQPPATLSDKADEELAALNAEDDAATATAANAAQAGKTLEEIEKEHILRVLDEKDWNRTAAAEVLQVSIRTLRNKLNIYKEQGVEIK